MAKRKLAQKPLNSLSSNVQKGRMVEQVVASMHREPGTTVECNVRLSPVGGKKRKREIDVLITRYVCGYPMRIAIECKNEVLPIGAKEIEAFATKLPYLGIPREQGIFVSASGYTIGAREAAEDARIRLLTLEDALQDLDEAMAQAIQSTVYLLPVINKLTIEDFSDRPLQNANPGMLFNERGELRGVVQDIIWHAWITGNLPGVIGQHEVKLNMPENETLYYVVDGQLVPLIGIKVAVQILGIVLQVTGKAEKHRLRNVVQNEVEKVQMNAHFDLPTEGTQTTITVQTEEELQRLVTQPAAFRLVNRVPLPRINFWHAMYWPPSERVVKIIAERMSAFEAGLAPDPRPFDIMELEGRNLNTIFEGITGPENAPESVKTDPSSPKLHPRKAEDGRDVTS